MPSQPKSRTLASGAGLILAGLGAGVLLAAIGPASAEPQKPAKADASAPVGETVAGAKPSKRQGKANKEGEANAAADRAGATGAARSAAAAAGGADPAPSGLAALPAPAAPSKAEIEFVAKLDEALGPVRGYDIPAAEAALLREAVKAIGGANLSKGLELRGKIKDPIALKIIEWMKLRSGYGTPAEFRSFLADNPDWPDRKLIIARMEEAVFTQGGTASSIKEHFKAMPPATGIGLAALASAHLIEGNTAEAKALASKAWREHNLPSTLETGFLERFGKLLEPADHKWRFDRLVIDDIRWRDERNARAAIAKRVVPLLAPEDQKKAPARIAMLLGSKKAVHVDHAAGGEKDWGVVFHHIQALRRSRRIEEAAKLMISAPKEPEKIVSPDDWWVERRQLAYGALKITKPRLAYDLVKEAGPLSANPLKEQTFMAGWLALRYLKDAKLALTHFEAMQKAADGPLSRAKASYWLGRAAEALGDAEGARRHYREATNDQDTFHGLLARQKLDPASRLIALAPPATPSADEIARFVSNDAVKAVVVARKANLEPSLLRGFIVHLRGVFKSEPEVAMVAHLSEAVGDTQMAVRTGKAAIAERKNLLYYAYPVHPFPAYTPLRKPPETAFLLGVARQETEFNNQTVSGAGAKGLLQVMTITAKHVCATYKIKCDIPRLLSDSSYNTMMASAYIGDRLAEFSGSYVLALAGYNAGPGRAREWIREFGDPRDPAVDPIDWIERIPIQETREYVAKVLANVQIYRARLGEENEALRIEEDLNRARRTKKASSDG